MMQRETFPVLAAISKAPQLGGNVSGSSADFRGIDSYIAIARHVLIVKLVTGSALLRVG